MLLEEVPSLSGEVRIRVNPLDPDVRVEKDHFSASQSSAAMGSVGLIYWMTVP